MTENVKSSTSDLLEAISTSVPLTLTEGTTVRCARTGQLGTIVGIYEKGSQIMVKSHDSEAVFYAVDRQLEIIDESGSGTPVSPAALARKTEKRVQQAVKLDPNAPRYNLNTITADQLCRALKGITPENAKMIISTRDSQSSGKFKDWTAVTQQLGNDFDIEAIKGTNILFIQ